MPPPEQIGPYLIIRKIGTGGMGDVFEARHGAIERRVAIKVLRKRDGQTEDFSKRFINEARAVNIVEHPGIVQIFDHGQLPDGTSYIVMEYLHGVTLTTHMKSGLGRLPLEDVLRISRQLASVLAAAHAKGIIHRGLNLGESSTEIGPKEGKWELKGNWELGASWPWNDLPPI